MKGDNQFLADEAVHLESLLTRIHDIRSRKDGARASALVALRRQLSARVAAMALVVRPILDRSSDAVAQAEFRKLHSTLLTNLALHQANWPAVLLLEKYNDAEYGRSARDVDSAAKALIDWLRRPRQASEF